jgi:hypothetical protein
MYIPATLRLFRPGGLVLAILGLSGMQVAVADELQFDLTGTAYSSTGASAGLFDISFMLDTQSGFVGTGFYDSNLPDNPYQNAFIVTNATYSNLNFIVDGTSIFSTPQAEGSYILTTLPSGGNTLLSNSGPPLLEWHFSPMPAYMSQATYDALPDPLATVFLSYQDNFNGQGEILTASGDTLDLVFASETVRDVSGPGPVVGVPEPGLLELMLLGLGAAFYRAHRGPGRRLTASRSQRRLTCGP